jgi:hypothetical protein
MNQTKKSKPRCHFTGRQGCPAWPAEPGAMERLTVFFVIEKALYELHYK